MKTAIKFIIWIVVLPLLLFAVFLLYISISDYQPEEIEPLYKSENREVVDKDSFNLIAWNIGYGGLGAEMDFFYDEGEKVRPDHELSKKYLSGISSFIENTQDIDFWLLQEVDVNSKRSYGVNQLERISNRMTDFHTVFAKNYDVSFVPVPYYEPMGYVNGGLMSLSKMTPSLAKRYAYPLIAKWPDKLFLLDRCFILSRYNLSNGKDLVVLNTHNSAYVYDSILRLKELNIIVLKMVEEYEKGNYVIAGGDWNANPPGLKITNYFNGHRFEPSVVKMNDQIFPGDWAWISDPTAPTNRDNIKPYVKGENGTTILDYFVVSPNVEVLDYKTIDHEFENSDHNPVMVSVAIK